MKLLTGSPKLPPILSFLLLRSNLGPISPPYYRNNLPAHFASKYKTIFPCVSNNKSWFYNLDLSRSTIFRFNRLRVGHSLLPEHAYKLGLNDSPLCTLHSTESVCDISHLLFDCPSLYTKRTYIILSI